MSTLSPFCVAKRTPFVWISIFPRVFLPTRFGLITRLSSVSLRPDLMRINCSSSFSPWAAFTSDSVSWAFTCLRHSLIYLHATLSLLFAAELFVFIVISFSHMLFGSSIGGNCMLGDGAMWKLILKYVHCPCTESEALLIVETWKGMNVVGELGISTAHRFTSTKI